MRGLESLIPQKKNTGENSGKKESVFSIETDNIRPNPYQPRREFDQHELESLAESIKVYGVLQPLLVTKVEHEVPSGRRVEYELVAGERRLRAAKIAGLPRVPVIIKHPVNNKQKLEISLIENIQRDDLNALEEARAYKRLNEEFNMSQAEIAQRISKSRPHVANVMRILSLPQNIQNALSRGEINEGHTRPLLSLNMSDSQEKLFEEIKRQGMTVRDAEERAREFQKEQNTEKNSLQRGGKSQVDPELVELVTRFKNYHNISNARVRTDGRRANLALSFASKKDLIEWVKRLTT